MLIAPCLLDSRTVSAHIFLNMSDNDVALAENEEVFDPDPGDDSSSDSVEDDGEDGGLTQFIQLIDVLLAHFFRDEYFATHYKPWFDALPIGTDVPPPRLMSLMLQWSHDTYMCCCQKLHTPGVVKNFGYFDPTSAKIHGFEYKFVQTEVPFAQRVAKPKPRAKSAGALHRSIASHFQPVARRDAQ